MSVLVQLSNLSRSGRYLHRFARAAVSQFSSGPVLPPDIEFDELKEKLDKDQVTLIDVRIPKELHNVGMIPKSKNIVVQTLGPNILMPEDEFDESFGFPKPALDEPVVLTCLAGLRARTAQLAMMGAGYTNVRVYHGSYEDWLEKGGEIAFPEPQS